MAVSVEQIADEMYEIVKESAGKKKLKSGDLTKAIIGKYGDEVSRADCKAAIRSLMDSGRTVYGYFGGSSIELPHTEAAENQ